MNSRFNETAKLNGAVSPMGCILIHRADGQGWSVVHGSLVIGRVCHDPGASKSRPWLAEPTVTEPDLPPYCQPRRSVEQAVIALLNRHYRLRDADRQRAEAQQEA